MSEEKIESYEARGKDDFFHETNGRLFYLIYQSELAFLHRTNSVLNSAQSRHKKDKGFLLFV